MIKKLTELCRPKQWKTIAGKELLSQGYPVYGANGIIGFWNTYNHNGDVLTIGCRGTCGALNLISGQSYINGNAMCLDDLSHEINIKYLYYYLKWYDLRKIITGTTIPQITIQGLEKVYVDYPSIENQSIIVEVLDKVYQIVNARQQELQKLDDLVKARFVEMFGDLMLNPFKWPVVKISDVSTFLKSGLSRKLSDDDIGLPVIRSGDIQNGQFIYGDVKYWYKEDPQGSKTEDYVLDDGDILVNFINSASQIGKTAIYRDVGRECIYTTNIFRMKLADNCNEYYYNWFAMSDYYYRQLQNIIQPAVNQASFTTVNFLKLNIPLPPMELQNEFATFVEQSDKSKFAVQNALDEAQLLFDSLMQKYFG